MTFTPRICLLIPVFNHGTTLLAVVKRAFDVHPHVLVVDDGSTDGGPASLTGLPIKLVVHRKNRGKGAAIMAGAARAASLGYTHVITLDADGQHDPEDAHVFVPIIEAAPSAIIVGVRNFHTPNVPNLSRFGRCVSNFLLRVQTGQVLEDVQSGFRVYPLSELLSLDLSETRYSFEVEVLAKAAWAGLPLREVPISVHYPPREIRVSHFDICVDSVRLGVLNAKLTVMAIKLATKGR